MGGTFSGYGSGAAKGIQVEPDISSAKLMFFIDKKVTIGVSEDILPGDRYACLKL